MKYCFFRNKSILLSGLFIVFSSLSGWTQSTTFSPYSRFGIGLLRPPGTPVHMGMGGIVATGIHSFAINSANPASYAWLQKPTFEIGSEGQFITLADNTGSQKIRLGSLSSLNFAFPMPRKPICFSFGLRPYSSSGFKVSYSEEIEEIGKVNYSYTGSGGVNVAHLGMAYSAVLGKTKRDSASTRVDKIAVGANLLALFGALENTARLQFTDPSYFGTVVTERTAAKDVGFNFGLIYRKTLHEKIENKKFKNRVDLTLGGNLDLGRDVNARYSRLVETYRPTTGADNIIDTTFFSNDIKGFFSLPQLLGAGASLDFVNAKGRSLLLSGEIRIQNWSAFKQAFEGVAPFSLDLTDSREMVIGIQYTPRDFYTAGISIFERINYRIGARLNSGNVSLSGNQIKESAIAAGVSIPFKWSGSRSGINLGTEVGNRGTTNAGLVKETFIRFNIGFTLTPYFGNQWFVQRKYD